MRESEKNRNLADDRKNITKPVFLAAAAFTLLTAVIIFLSVKAPLVVIGLRDLLVSLLILLMFIIGAGIIVLCFFLSSRIESAKQQIDNAVSNADGKIEELAEKITKILQQILNPLIEMQSRKAGVVSFFSRKNNKE